MARRAINAEDPTAKLEARIIELEDALKPFAKSFWLGMDDKTNVYGYPSWEPNDKRLVGTVGDFKRAYDEWRKSPRYTPRGRPFKEPLPPVKATKPKVRVQAKTKASVSSNGRRTW